MIDHRMILEGIKYGLIQFIVDPNLEHGTVCAIGDHWFYFGDETTSGKMNPEEYLKTVPIEGIVEEIFSALESFRVQEDFSNEYRYYEAILNEALGAKSPLVTREEAVAQRDAAIADLAAIMTELRGSSFCTDSRFGICVNPTCYAHGGNGPCEFMWRGAVKKTETKQ